MKFANLAVKFKKSWLSLFVMAAAIWPSLPVRAAGSSVAPAAVGLPTPLAGISLPILIGRVIQYALGLTGIIALIMFIYGGFLWMTAAGNEERVGDAKKTLVWATIGLILIFSSYSLANFIISRLQS